jgi:hypothetical protein
VPQSERHGSAAPERHAPGEPPSAGGVLRRLAESPSRAFCVIFFAATVTGAALLPFVPPDWFVPHSRWETNAVAVSLATRGTFADPYALPTGPTAHVPPFFPVLLAAIYAAFGMTAAAGHVTFLVQLAASAAMVAMLPWLAHRLGATREAGVIGGLAGALLPRWAYQVECFAGVALGLLLAWHVARWRSSRPGAGGALALGVAWGAACHVTPSLLPVLVGCLAFEVWQRAGPAPWRGVAATVLGVVLACTPWTLRNYAVFGDVVFMRSNFGLELRMGNHDGAVADIDTTDVPGHQVERHPRTNLAEARHLQQVGERAYMREARREALAWIGANPGAFVALCAKRALYFWVGAPSQGRLAVLTGLLTVLAAIGLWGLWPTLLAPQRAAFAIPLLTFPLVYYTVVFMPRYRAPLSGLVLVLAGSATWRWLERLRAGPSPPLG